MISYQLARPFHFYSINILAALKWLRPKSHNKSYMAWSEIIFLLRFFKNSNFMYTHIHAYTHAFIHTHAHINM